LRPCNLNNIYVIMISMKKNQNKKEYRKEKLTFTPLSTMKKELMKRQGFRKVYEESQFEFEILKALIIAREQKKLTQRKLADKIGVAQSALARFESGRVNPRLDFIGKLASGLGLKLIVK
jgi:ribosome-binding protein aMBF1 (putative translation factor)